MTEGWEHFADNEDGEPVFLTDDGQLLDSAGTEYQVEAEPEPQPEYDYGHQPSEAEAMATVEQHVQAQRADLEQQLDRKLTPGEAHAMASHLGSQLDRGEGLDVYAAHVERGSHYDLNNTRDRRAWMAESLKDGAPPAPVSRPAADAPASEHRDFIKAQLNGAEVVNNLDTED